MDPSEDLSCRVLLKQILITEPPRTPVSHSARQAPSGSGVRRSSRLSRNAAEPQTPQNILRRSLKHKVQESITRKSQPATRRRTASAVLRKQVASTSMHFNDEETPRHLLMNILQTEPVKSPVIHEKVLPGELQPPSAENTVTRTRSSIELSGLELPDITLENVMTTKKGLSRKRQRRSLNVTAFEKRLKDGNDNEEDAEDSSVSLSSSTSLSLKTPYVDVRTEKKGLRRRVSNRRKITEEEFIAVLDKQQMGDAQEDSDNSTDDHSSVSLSSCNSLNLKTPFFDVHTEKRGLQRQVSNRKKITEEEFIAALDKQQMGDVSHHRLRQQNLIEDTNIEGLTLGLSKFSEPDITVDIVNCHTALYDQHDAMTSNLSIIATQDKPTVIASQLQRDIQVMEEEEHRKEEKPADVVFDEEDAATDSEKAESVSDTQGKEDVDKTEPRDAEADNQPDHAQDSATSSKSKEKEGVEYQTFILGDEVESVEIEVQTEGEAVADSHVDGGSRSEQEEAAEEPQGEDEGVDPSKTEEEAVADFQSENNDALLRSQTRQEGRERSQTVEEDGLPETEEIAADSQVADVAASHFEEEEPQAEDEGVEQSETEEDAAAADSQADDVAASESEEEEAAAGSQTEEEAGSESQAEEVAVNQSGGDVEEEPHAEEGADGQADKDLNENEMDQEEEWESEQLEHEMGHVSRRAYHSEGGLVLAAIKAKDDSTDATAAGSLHSKSKGHSALGLNMNSHSQTEEPDWPKPFLQDRDNSLVENDPVGEKNNSFHHLQDEEVCGKQRSISPEEASDEDAAEQDGDLDEEDYDVEGLSSKTPAFVREKRTFFTSDPPALPSATKNIQASSTSEALPAAKQKQARRRKTNPSRKKPVLPKTYVMNVFRHFAKTKVSADVFPVLNELLDKFFDRVAEDLDTYAAHAKRSTIEVEDVELLLRRQGYINDKVPVEVLIEKYLRMEQRRILIPIATSGNVVIPKIRK